MTPLKMIQHWWRGLQNERSSTLNNAVVSDSVSQTVELQSLTVHEISQRRVDNPLDRIISGEIERNPAQISDPDGLVGASALVEASRNGDAQAQFALALLHLSGREVRRSSFLAERWLAAAARAGHTEAQYRLGLLCWAGSHDGSRIRQAALWIRLAASNGHRNAYRIWPTVRRTLLEYERAAKLAKQAAAERLKRLAKEKRARAQSKRTAFEAKEQLRRKASIDRTSDKYMASHSRPSTHSSHPVSKEYRFNTSFGYAISSPHYAPEYYRFHERGRRRGAQCVAAAKVALRFHQSERGLGRYLATSDLALRIANRRGFTSVGVSFGMTDLIDGSDPLFDERRSAFMQGVVEAITQA